MANAALIGTGAALFCVLILGAIAGLYLMKKKKSGDTTGFFTPRHRRLSCVDRIGIDGGRKLILIRRDNVEHLVMIGGPMDLVVETNIKGAVPASLDAAWTEGSARDLRHEPEAYDNRKAAFGVYPATATAHRARHGDDEEPLTLTPHSEIKATR